MPLYNIIARDLNPSEGFVQRIDDGQAMRSVLQHLSSILGIPSMKNYIAFSCDENSRPVARLDMDTCLEEQGILPFSYIYITPVDVTPKGANGEELPLLLDLKWVSKEIENVDISPSTPPLPDDNNTGGIMGEGARERGEEGTRRNIEEEVRRGFNGQRTGISLDFFSSDALPGDGVVSLSAHGTLHAVQENRNSQRGLSSSTGAEHHVHLNLVPDVIGVAAGQEQSVDVEQHTPGEVAHKLAAVAKNQPLHYEVLLQLANFLLCHRPNVPQLFLWSHQQGKLCPTPTSTHAERGDDCLCSSDSPLTIAPVGNTTEERLLSVVRGGPAKEVLRHWARFLLDIKPDNPTLFMWEKLEAKLTKGHIGVVLSNQLISFSSDDPAKVGLLRGLTRSNPAYNLLRSLVNLMFDKKPDAPEVWLLDHIIGKRRASRTTSRRSSVAQPESLCEWTAERNRVSDVEEGTTDCEFSQLRVTTQEPWKDRSASLSGGEKKKKKKTSTSDISTQTHLTFQTWEILKLSPVKNKSPRKSPSPLQNTQFLQERSPRELLQLSYDSSVLLHHSHDQCNAVPSDEPSSLSSPVHQEKYRNITNSLRHTGSNLPPNQRSRSHSHDVPPVFREEGTSGHGALSHEWSGGVGVLHAEPGPMPSREDPPYTPPTRGTLASAPCCRPPGWQDAVRRRETERAEILYEYNWLLQRETLRNEQLQKEVAVFRQEKELRKLRAQQDPSADVVLAAEVAARAQAEAETRLAALNQQGLPRTEEEMGLFQPPTELDVIRKRLELLSMEEARLRYLARSAQSPVAQGSGNRVHDPQIPSSHDSSAVRRRGEQVGIPLQFTPSIEIS